MLLVHRLKSAQALCLQGEEAVEHFVHGAAVDKHGTHLLLLPLGDVQLQDLVHALLEVERGHDHEVDGTPQIHEVLLGKVQDLLRGLLVRGLLLLRVIGVRAAVAAVVLLDAQDLGADMLPLGLVRRVLLRRLCLENVDGFLALDRVIEEVNLVGDLVLLVDEVQLLHQHGEVRILFPSDLEEALNDVLHAPVNLALVKDVSEALIDEMGSSSRKLL
mmetsp:Transcript_103842/g.263747  ORF Transcript_103842/g.263747 Transcript_103842/m.263747 type:complete len:217 (+) Transcript_103842:529-1179(+)